jgi:transcriptional regulator with XRE-family HTH domain
MNLREYLFRNRLTIKKFAAICGYHPDYIANVINGRVNESHSLLRRVIHVTDGKVNKICSTEEENEKSI